VKKPDAVLRDQLIECARILAKKRGWTWHDPVDITAAAHNGEPVWVVRTNILMRGQNVRVVLRKADHTILQAAYLPR
jgi:hypothetical protein